MHRSCRTRPAERGIQADRRSGAEGLTADYSTNMLPTLEGLEFLARILLGELARMIGRALDAAAWSSVRMQCT